MEIRIALTSDINKLSVHDKHISRTNLLESIHQNHIYILEDGDLFIGWLRYNLFWDNTPFMNLIYILDRFQNKGYGTKLVLFWEKSMKSLGYDYVMTSTASNENAQYFYKKLGYNEVGGFNYKNDPYELLFSKAI